MESKPIDTQLGSPTYWVTPEDESGRRLLQRYLSRRREELAGLKMALGRGDYRCHQAG